MRISDGAFRASADGGSLHRLVESGPHDSAFRSFREQPTVTIVSVEIRDRVYRSLLETLTLDSQHALDLLGRGLSDTTIARNMYASVCGEVDSIAQELGAKLGKSLASVPGFVQRGGRRWHLTSALGELLIPVRNERGLIAAILRKTGDPSNKYKWLSSASFRGPSPGNPLPLHFAAPHRVETNHAPLIVEGALKADVTADLSGFAVVGLPSISAVSRDTVETLLRALPHAQKWGVALDQDKRTNNAVRDAEKRLVDALRSVGRPVFVLDWNRGKGPDDFLAEVRCA